jgi:hypothetical protein
LPRGDRRGSAAALPWLQGMRERGGLDRQKPTAVLSHNRVRLQLGQKKARRDDDPLPLGRAWLTQTHTGQRSRVFEVQSQVFGRHEARQVLVKGVAWARIVIGQRQHAPAGWNSTKRLAQPGVARVI